ncbi:hypothetical protein Pst134EB_008464 [Puccinia striiformis f. sp. tritici]|nr:hypothetical protein Pst134EB_008464 [Puccinia striiformis f. sp. tritici]
MHSGSTTTTQARPTHLTTHPRYPIRRISLGDSALPGGARRELIVSLPMDYPPPTSCHWLLSSLPRCGKPVNRPASPFTALEQVSHQKLLHPTIIKNLPTQKMVLRAIQMMYISIQEAFCQELEMHQGAMYLGVDAWQAPNGFNIIGAVIYRLKENKSGTPKLNAMPLSFVQLKGSHTGKYLARMVQYIVEKFGLQNRTTHQTTLQWSPNWRNSGGNVSKRLFGSRQDVPGFLDRIHKCQYLQGSRLRGNDKMRPHEPNKGVEGFPVIGACDTDEPDLLVGGSQLNQDNPCQLFSDLLQDPTVNETSGAKPTLAIPQKKKGQVRQIITKHNKGSIQAN